MLKNVVASLIAIVTVVACTDSTSTTPAAAPAAAVAAVAQPAAPAAPATAVAPKQETVLASTAAPASRVGEREAISAASITAENAAKAFLGGINDHTSCDVDEDYGDAKLNKIALAAVADVQKSYEKLIYGDGEHDVTMADVDGVKTALTKAKAACAKAGDSAAKGRAADHE